MLFIKRLILRSWSKRKEREKWISRLLLIRWWIMLQLLLTCSRSLKIVVLITWLKLTLLSLLIWRFQRHDMTMNILKSNVLFKFKCFNKNFYSDDIIRRVSESSEFWCNILTSKSELIFDIMNIDDFCISDNCLHVWLKFTTIACIKHYVLFCSEFLNCFVYELFKSCDESFYSDIHVIIISSEICSNNTL